uniref:Uncharacterized protein n=1 Tax=uncultured bacterium Contigcl_1493 TaxID=1393647 RepID=W0FQX0_9BACT|nr:hypothetical protein [uncultured bacterium Contigcl_1493]
MVRDELDVGAEVADGDHHALRVAGGAGRVHQGAELVQVALGETDVLAGEAARVGGGEGRVAGGVALREVAARGQQLAALGVDGAEQGRHGLEVHLVEDGLLGVEDAAVGMVDELHRVGGREAVEELHGHEAAGLGGEEGLAPAGAGTGVDGDLVPGLQAGRLPEPDGLVQLGGELTIGDARGLVFFNGGFVPAFEDGALERLQETVVGGEVVHFCADRI